MRSPTLTAFALLAFAPLARAQQAPPLTWSAPAGCPSRDEVFARALAAGLRHDVALAWAAEATVRHTPRTPWRLEMLITVRGDRVTQRRSAATCAALAQLAGVDLALVLNTFADDVVALPAPPPPPPPPPPPMLGGAASTPPSVPVAPPAPSRAWRVLVGAHVVTDVGLFPVANVGIGGALAMLWNEARVQLAATYFPAVATDAQRAVPAGVATIGGAVFSVRGCGRFAGARLSLDGCLGVEGGFLDVRAGPTVTAPRSPRVGWFGVLVGAEGAVRVTPWMLVSAGLDVGRTVGQPTITVDNLGVVHAVADWHLTPRVGVAIAL